MVGMRDQIATVDTENHEITVSVSTPVVDVSVERPTITVEVVGAPGPPGPPGEGGSGVTEVYAQATEPVVPIVTMWADTSSPQPPGSGGAGGHEIQDEGAGLPARAKLNFVGEAVTVTDNAANDSTVITVTGGGSAPAFHPFLLMGG